MRLSAVLEHAMDVLERTVCVVSAQVAHGQCATSLTQWRSFPTCMDE